MPHSVFISYARNASMRDAQALAARLGDSAFLDTDAIRDGDEFARRILDALLDARVVVIFATEAYAKSLFCRLEMRVALAASTPQKKHVVLALGEDSASVLNAIPEAIAKKQWPPATATERLEELVLLRLESDLASLRSTFPESDVRRITAAFLEEANIQDSQSLHSIVCSLPQDRPARSIGARFVGRTGELRRIHDFLSRGSGKCAALTSRIAAAGGFGKTQLAAEYLHRYGPRYYPGGLFWINAATNSIDEEFWRVLSALDPTIPNIGIMREQKRSIRRELEVALRRIDRPVLYIVDNVPEAAPAEDPLPIEYYCPAVGAVSVLATSRQDTCEPGVQTISINTLGSDAAVLLLTDNILDWHRLAWDDWKRIAEWVGNLPLALDLLNRSLALDSVLPEDLLGRVTQDLAPSAVAEIERLSEALRGQVPPNAIRGITETFRISFEKLDELAKAAALILAQLAPDPIPEDFFAAMPEECASAKVRAALHSRHFVTHGIDESYMVMHRLMAAFLRGLAGESSSEAAVIAMLSMTRAFPSNDDDKHWPKCRALLPHVLTVLDRAPTIIAEFDDEGWLAHRKGQLSDRVTRYRKKVHDSEESKEVLEGILHYTNSEKAARIIVKQFSTFKYEIRFRIMREALEQSNNENLQPIRSLLESQPQNFQNNARAAAKRANELTVKLRELLTQKNEASKETALNELVSQHLEEFPIHLQSDLRRAYESSKGSDARGIVERFAAMRRREEARTNLYRMLDIPEPVKPPTKAKSPWSWLTPWRIK